jgi:hypothetical protein
MTDSPYNPCLENVVTSNIEAKTKEDSVTRLDLETSAASQQQAITLGERRQSCLQLKRFAPLEVDRFRRLHLAPIFLIFYSNVVFRCEDLARFQKIRRLQNYTGKI